MRVSFQRVPRDFMEKTAWKNASVLSQPSATQSTDRVLVLLDFEEIDAPSVSHFCALASKIYTYQIR